MCSAIQFVTRWGLGERMIVHCNHGIPVHSLLLSAVILPITVWVRCQSLASLWLINGGHRGSPTVSEQRPASEVSWPTASSWNNGQYSTSNGPAGPAGPESPRPSVRRCHPAPCAAAGTGGRHQCKVRMQGPSDPGRAFPSFAFFYDTPRHSRLLSGSVPLAASNAVRPPPGSAATLHQAGTEHPTGI
jgi:hypothetical protein